MKKFLLSLIALLGVGTYALADGFSVADVEIRSGKSGVLELAFNTSFYGRSFQLDFDLPEGIEASVVQKGEAVTAADGKYMIDGNVYEGAYRVAYTDFDGSILENGVAAYITLNDTQGYDPGTEFTVTVKNQEYLYQETAEAGSRLVKANPDDFTFKIKIVEDLITLYDTETEAPAAATGQNVKVVRALKADQWNTICLPFAVSDPEAVFGEGVQVADFIGCVPTYASDDDDYAQSIKVNFSSVTEMEANHPYIIKVRENLTDFTVNGVDIVSATVDDLTLALDETKISRTVYHYNYFIGTYVAGTPVEAGSVIISGNKFYVTKGTTIKAFRGYFYFEVDQIADMIDSGMALVKMSLDDDVTAIDNIEIDGNGEGWYDISGRKLNAKPTMKGIYINNGKKQLVK